MFILTCNGLYHLVTNVVLGFIGNCLVMLCTEGALKLSDFQRRYIVGYSEVDHNQHKIAEYYVTPLSTLHFVKRSLEDNIRCRISDRTEQVDVSQRIAVKYLHKHFNLEEQQEKNKGKSILCLSLVYSK